MGFCIGDARVTAPTGFLGLRKFGVPRALVNEVKQSCIIGIKTDLDSNDLRPLGLSFLAVKWES